MKAKCWMLVCGVFLNSVGSAHAFQMLCGSPNQYEDFRSYETIKVDTLEGTLKFYRLNNGKYELINKMSRVVFSEEKTPANAINRFPMNPKNKYQIVGRWSDQIVFFAGRSSHDMPYNAEVTEKLGDRSFLALYTCKYL